MKYLSLVAALCLGTQLAQADTTTVGQSPWGSADEIGALNRITPESTLNVVKRVKSGMHRPGMSTGVGVVHASPPLNR